MLWTIPLGFLSYFMLPGDSVDIVSLEEVFSVPKATMPLLLFIPLLSHLDQGHGVTSRD